MKGLFKMLSWAAAFIIIASAGGIGKLVGKAAFNDYTQGRDAAIIDASLLKVSNDLNARLPMMIDSETRLDGTMAANKVITYRHTLVNYSASSVSANDLTNNLRQKLINGVCTTDVTKALVKKGVSYSYAYYGNDGRQITTITVTPPMCSP